MTFDVVGQDLIKDFETEEGGTVKALRNVGFEVEQGHFFVLVGDSGSGKTTLLRCIAVLERPDSGEITLRGETMFSSRDGTFVNPQERGIGMVFQSYAIWPYLTVYENIALPLRDGRQRLPKAEVRRRVSDALETVGLSGLADRPAPNLSGGQQQRVALARAIAVSSSLLLMDEPMSNLDARLREDVRAQIKSVASHYNTTVLYVTHDQVEAMALADQMALMRQGEILQRGTPEELYDRSASIEVAEFFGPMNLIEGEISGDGEIRTKIGSLHAATGDCTEKNVLIGLRPERIRVVSSSTDDPDRIEAIVTDQVFLGGTKVYEIDCNGVKLRLEAVDSFAVDERIVVKFPAEALRLFPNPG
jgi:iron(III) transport system ATP-binding protein